MKNSILLFIIGIVATRYLLAVPVKLTARAPNPSLNNDDNLAGSLNGLSAPVIGSGEPSDSIWR